MCLRMGSVGLFILARSRKRRQVNQGVKRALTTHHQILIPREGVAILFVLCSIIGSESEVG